MNTHRNLGSLGGLVCLLSVIFMACSNNISQGEKSERERSGEPVASEQLNFYVDTLHTGMENPWGMTFLPDGKMLLTERKGEILIFENGNYSERKVQGFPDVYQRGQGGLLDIQTHPSYDENGWIYATYAKPGGEGGSTALLRFKLDGDQATDLEELYHTQPMTRAGVHFGSRIIFDRDGYLYFGTGDRGIKENAQDLTNDMGKVHRLHDDGRIPADNPFVNTIGAMPSIWSYGHRNIQGMVFDSENNRIYATEHGPRGGDELNIVEKGKNYGWPVITYGINYDGTEITKQTEQEGMQQPIHYWTPSIATCGLMLYTGDKFPEWKGNIFSGSLVLTHVARVVVENGRYSHEEKLLDQVGRVRHVTQDKEGYIYVLTEGPGMLLRLAPVNDN